MILVASAATTAVGYHKLHVRQQEEVVNEGLVGGQELIETGSIRTRGK